jgi:hypothetical protein
MEARVGNHSSCQTHIQVILNKSDDKKVCTEENEAPMILGTLHKDNFKHCLPYMVMEVPERGIALSNNRLCLPYQQEYHTRKRATSLPTVIWGTINESSYIIVIGEATATSTCFCRTPSVKLQWDLKIFVNKHFPHFTHQFLTICSMRKTQNTMVIFMSKNSIDCLHSIFF